MEKTLNTIKEFHDSHSNIFLKYREEKDILYSSLMKEIKKYIIKEYDIPKNKIRIKKDYGEYFMLFSNEYWYRSDFIKFIYKITEDYLCKYNIIDISFASYYEKRGENDIIKTRRS